MSQGVVVLLERIGRRDRRPQCAFAHEGGKSGVDSGQHWAAGGAWLVNDGIYRIPLPLPSDVLKAVNVYVIVTDDGLTMIDGGWAIDVAREVLERCLRQFGAGFGDIR